MLYQLKKSFFKHHDWIIFPESLTSLLSAKALCASGRLRQRTDQLAGAQSMAKRNVLKYPHAFIDR